MFGHWEIIVLLVVVLLIFGPSQLPKLAKGIGKSLQSFKSGMKDAQEDDDKPSKDKELGSGDAEKKRELPEKKSDD